MNFMKLLKIIIILTILKLKIKLLLTFIIKIKKEIYVDLSKRIDELIEDFFHSIGIGINNKTFILSKVCERKNESETTKYIYENPKIKAVFQGSSSFFINRFLFLEYIIIKEL